MLLLLSSLKIFNIYVFVDFKLYDKAELAKVTVLSAEKTGGGWGWQGGQLPPCSS